MKVSDLAEELEVPPSAVLAQCQRFSIDASWAGAELSGSDVVILRAELASGAPIDLTPADPVEEPVAVVAGPAPSPSRPSSPAPTGGNPAPAEPVSPGTGADDVAPTNPADLPPTAVGSIPEVAAELTPDAEPETSRPRLPGGHQGTQAGAPVTPEGVRTVAPRTAPAERRLDRAARTSLIALVVAAAAYVGANYVDSAALVAVLWLVSATALIVAVIDAFRGRRHALTHPDRVRGVWLASIATVLAVAGIIGLTATVLSVTADDPADAPVDLSDLASVQTARWGYQRTTLLADNGWRQVARDSGSCWRHESRRKERAEDRVEANTMNETSNCGQMHNLEVVKVFAYDRDADTAYPGADNILIAAQQQCADVFAKAQKRAPGAKTDVEYPTEVGWGEADHDIACTVTTEAERTGKLVP